MGIIKSLLFTIISVSLLEKYGWTGCCNNIKINWKNILILIPILTTIAIAITLI